MLKKKLDDQVASLKDCWSAEIDAKLDGEVKHLICQVNLQYKVCSLTYQNASYNLNAS